MRAIVCERYGPPEVLELTDVDAPVHDDHEVRIRVRAAAVNPVDWHLMKGEPYIVRPAFGLLRPKSTVPGTDAAGVVEAVGDQATRLRPGDEVFGYHRGAFAELLCAPEDSFVAKPANLTFEEAAAVPVAALTALQGLRDKGELQPGQSVLINGASGGVGTFAVQIAKALGAEVIGVCSSRNVELVRSIGADHVIDYTREDFIRNERRFDLFLDCVGNRSLSACRCVLKPTGSYVIVGGPKGRWLGGVARMLRALLIAPFVPQKVVPFIAESSEADLLTLKELIEADKVTPVIDRRYGLDEVPEAMRYQATGRARGKIVIHVSDADDVAADER